MEKTAVYLGFALVLFSRFEGSAETYTWKSGVASGRWSDGANWTCDVDNPASAYPNSDTCTATFAQRSGSVTVQVDGHYTVDKLILRRTDLAISFIGTGTNNSSIVSLSGDCTRGGGQTLLLDAVSLSVSQITAGNENTSMRLQNGAYLRIAKDHPMKLADERIELVGDSCMYVQSGLRQRNANNVVRIEDSTFITLGNYCPAAESAATGSVTEFAGTHPVLQASQIRQGDSGAPSSEFKPVFRFDIPAAGYEAPPIVLGSRFPYNTSIGIRCEVPETAGCFRNGETRRFKLVGVTTGNSIQSDYIDFSDQPNPEQTVFYYTYGADDSLQPSGKPTGLWVKIRGTGPTVMSLL